ncbi:glycosyltransferase family 1 protein [Acinetobacter thermotolerans]|uniref:glycosyltransferase family 4 protein n=1 Tax=Acinetobacter thermotolerans TaxID=3151487 RepID=UPI00325A927B
MIDLQGAQSASRYRGIGRYSLELAKEMVRQRGEHEILIVLNGLFPETIIPIQDAFKDLLPIENILIWYAPGPVFGSKSSNRKRRYNAELIREQFLVNLKPDIVYISSLIEGFVDNAVHSIGLSPSRLLTAVTSYDLIPLVYKNIYLTPNPEFELFYLEKLEYLRQADLLLTISSFSRFEAIEYLGVTLDKIINISAAADSKFKQLNIEHDIKKNILQKFGLQKPFIMYSGASDPRKNLLGLIKAFANLPAEIKNNTQLAIIGKLPKIDRLILEVCIKSCDLDPSHVIITGSVSDEEMILFYNLCELFVFPSWHEGFGLPVLEAMSCGAPVVCSNTSSLPEVVGREDALFDPFDEHEIASKIEEVLTNPNFRAELIRHGLARSKSFSWERSAKKALIALENCVAQHQVSEQKVFEPEEWWKIAYYNQKKILNKLTLRHIKLRLMAGLGMGRGLKLVLKLRLILILIYESVVRRYRS